ncbi:hypothetical protein J8273_6937 [Carpediemonas membranifera]|uniref:Uncharacterized protein n=1 Tax=Carpediemonas membranifera TaxID=201153 RepID=A0A8J6DZG8_9EUKA|nr:hypothetical protein J8273_6937 [Carpediemonas membranifera]|eukprot:KAG9390698.1 hypothetical protein J8273_6937 [Carpediemonas membranifera]
MENLVHDLDALIADLAGNDGNLPVAERLRALKRKHQSVLVPDSTDMPQRRARPEESSSAPIVEPSSPQVVIEVPAARAITRRHPPEDISGRVSNCFELPLQGMLSRLRTGQVFSAGDEAGDLMTRQSLLLLTDFVTDAVVGRALRSHFEIDSPADAALAEALLASAGVTSGCFSRSTVDVVVATLTRITPDLADRQPSYLRTLANQSLMRIIMISSHPSLYCCWMVAQARRVDRLSAHKATRFVTDYYALLTNDRIARIETTISAAELVPQVSDPSLDYVIVECLRHIELYNEQFRESFTLVVKYQNYAVPGLTQLTQSMCTCLPITNYLTNARLWPRVRPEWHPELLLARLRESAGAIDEE